jgi:hypothetical protein
MSPKAPAMSLSMQATQIPMFPGLPHFSKRGAKTPTKTPADTIPQRDAKKFLTVVIDYPPSLTLDLDHRHLVTDSGQEGGKGWKGKLRIQEVRNKMQTSLFSLSFY